MPRTKIRKPNRNQPGYENVMLSPNRIKTAAHDTYTWRFPRRARATCPPSSCPAGSRLIAVTKSPTQPANARGCMPSVCGSGKNNERKLNKIEGRIASPATPAETPGAPVERASPASVTGMALAKPTRGPDTPMSRSARRLGIGSRMLMNAPKVPSGGRDGRKNGRDAWALYRFATREGTLSWQPRIVRGGRVKNKGPKPNDSPGKV